MKPSEIKFHSLDSKPEGSAFFELLPRPYKKECWNADSIYLDEEVFGLIEPVIIESVMTYDHYAFTELRPKEIERIIERLDALSSLLRSSDAQPKSRLGYFFQTTEREVEADWPNFRLHIIDLCDDLSLWMKQILNSGRIITILGI